MLVGASITYLFTPETSDIHGRSRKLEDLAKGKSHRKKMEQEERDAGTRDARELHETMLDIDVPQYDTL